MRFGRRLFLRGWCSALAVGVAALTSTTVGWLAVVGRFLAPSGSQKEGRIFKAGHPGEFLPGKVDTRFSQSRGVWIVCDAGPSGRCLYALRVRCTHLGCLTRWHEGEGLFRCPCHGSAFTMRGLNVAGPAPRPLERCAICLNEEGHIEIDTERTYRQERGEWSDPASYLVV